MNFLLLHSESLTIKLFGSNIGSCQQCKIVNLCIDIEGSDNVTLSAICVPVISSPFKGQSLPKIDLTFGDDCEEEAQIDILVGTNQYWNLVTGRVVQGESGPTTIHTKLAWVLSGPVHCQVPSSATAINLTSSHVLKCQVMDPPDSDMLDILKSFGGWKVWG